MERPYLSRNGATILVFLPTPGPTIGPQKIIGTLLCPRGCLKTWGSNSASHGRLITRADHEKGYPPGFLFGGVRRCTNQAKGFLATKTKGSPSQSRLLRHKLLTERSLISHDVIANPGQFIAQRFGSQARVCLSHFAIIVSSEVLIVPPGQMGSLGKCPA